MLLAQEHDAVEDGVAYISTYRRRLVAPDTRSRVVGYLAAAPVAAPGFRTDGEWVWPESLADHARELGAAPQDQLFEHMRQRWFLLPDAVSPTQLASAADASAGPAVADPAPAWDWVHLGGYLSPTAPADVLLRVRSREDGSLAESRYQPTGWDTSHTLQAQQSRRIDQRQYVEISGREAAALNSRLGTGARDALLSRVRESEPDGRALRLARVFDGESPAGTPWFSPGRLRIPEPVRRERLAGYLMAGRLVLRVSDPMPDPMDPGHRVPMSYRTDGCWVWQEALAHYLLTRGVAPELDLLCHIEERGYAAPAGVPDGVVPVAAALVKSGQPPRLARPAPSYRWEPSGGIARSWAPGDSDTLRDDLRWGRISPDRALGDDRAVGTGRRAITEAEAVAFIDARWAAGAAVPPLD
jgi:hypothetical protein